MNSNRRAERRFTRLGMLVAAIVMLAAGGCAHQGAATRGVDVERLLNAIAIDDAGYVRAAVSSGAARVDDAVPAPGYPDGAPLITLAARDGAVDVLRFLLSSGANPDAGTPVGETALMLAAYFPNDERDEALRERHERAVRLLLESGAAVNNKPHHYTALGYAAYRNRQRIMAQLLARGAAVDGSVSGGMTYVNTPLMMAAIQGHYEAAVSLLRAGADPRVRVHRGHTAAELAAKYNHHRLARLLQCAASREVAAADIVENRCL